MTKSLVVYFYISNYKKKKKETYFKKYVNYSNFCQFEADHDQNSLI